MSKSSISSNAGLAKTPRSCRTMIYGKRYHPAMFDNAGKTALQMGHREIGTLFEHYRRAVRKEDAEKFWAIRPARDAKVIALPV